MIWPLKKTVPQVVHSALALNPFIAEALKEQTSNNEVETRLFVECYIYGAVRYLASYDDLNAENSKVLMHQMLADHFNADRDEVNSSLKRLSEVQDGKTEQLFMIEGASALRRWLVNGDRSVTRDLKNLLDMHIQH